MVRHHMSAIISAVAFS